MNDTVYAIIPHSLVGIVASIITLCAAIVAAIPAPVNPTTKAGKIWESVWKAIDFIALNFGHGATTAASVKKGDVIPAAQVAVSTPAFVINQPTSVQSSTSRPMPRSAFSKDPYP